MPAQGAMYLMPDVHATGLSDLELANALLDTHRIAVTRGERFGTAATGYILGRAFFLCFADHL
ncbi:MULTISPECIES: hypothetical protein [unclassified Ruegeria]|uniref:hypothetical protein n=1 Tax=unclassified Ruegeria TaxID=2625375 RepID=UPI001ADBF798|nr:MULTISPECIES: hypothetical protein [unclassified Ruegeria]MBO9410638.1 hypothetical protein [Ruegeria sp. R8_1]MBO9414143.1 hypothetical protein [Ruegeria sp. R8_2]